MTKEITLNQAIKVMNLINANDIENKYNVYFEGCGNGKIKIVVESNIIEVKGNYN